QVGANRVAKADTALTRKQVSIAKVDAKGNKDLLGTPTGNSFIGCLPRHDVLYTVAAATRHNPTGSQVAEAREPDVNLCNGRKALVFWCPCCRQGAGGLN
ncbi:hypothetical protein AKJ16_DCAP04377, partial [Drosera capensis]